MLLQLEYRDDTSYGYLELDLAKRADPAASERKLRAAISKVAGKAAGSEKYWDLGGCKFTLDMCDDGVQVLFTHRLIDPRNAEQGETGFFEKPVWGASWPLCRLHNGLVRVSGHTSPSANPPGVRPKSVVDSGQQLGDYFVAELGESDAPESFVGYSTTRAWTRDSRTVKISALEGRGFARSSSRRSSSPDIPRLSRMSVARFSLSA